MKEIISHLYQDKTDGQWVIQTNAEHTAGVAERAERFASKFGMPVYGRVMGMLHDKGKESDAFQQHIRRESGYAPEMKVTGDTHHAYVGGVIARGMYGKSYDNFLVNQISSHHTGLHDTDELDCGLNKEIPHEIVPVEKIPLNRPPSGICKRDFHHVGRMLYSCLVDADYLDTESFMDRESAALREGKATLTSLLPMLETYLKSLKENASISEVNRLRNQVQEQCLKMSKSDVGFFSLTVPTGGGKTLSSLLWAMMHAIYNNQERIVIAIPYTSIIVQTAAILRGIFGEDNVLEHHSNVDYDSIGDGETIEKMRLATENWDYPIVVTTNVQLLESMFSNRPSKCRKLHNIVNSVIIMDEVQTLPTDYLQPIVDSLKTYNKLFNVSILFTTASQPVLSGLIEGCNPKAAFDGISEITEIIPEDFQLHDRLRRVRLEIDDEGKNYDEVAEMICRHKRVLCIVNTREDARELYERLPQEGVTLHLSKMMCPAHISKTIERMKTALKDDSIEIIRVISTQLVEAGVDIDFPVVYRQEAGLDSVLQAAGRCNREGKNKLCTTYVFSLSKVHPLPQGHMTEANDARKNMVGIKDLFAPVAMTSYFRQLYCRKSTFDKKKMKEYLYNPMDIYFSTAAREFRLIEEAGRNVIVCWEDSMDLMQELMHKGPSYMLMKKLSKYTVNIYERDFKALKALGVVSEEAEGVFCVKYKEQYDEHTGLRIGSSWADKVLMA